MANATAYRVDSDLDAQSPAADLVRVYLNGIGKTALLTAADEVELAPAGKRDVRHRAPSAQVSPTRGSRARIGAGSGACWRHA